MGPLTIGALIAMIAGAGVQYETTKKAQKDQAKAIESSLERQRVIRERAEKNALELAKTFAPAEREKAQAQIENQMAADFEAPVSESAAIRAEQNTTQGNVSGEYSTAKAASEVETLKSASMLARLLAKTNSARRLRIDEADRFADGANRASLLGNFSEGTRRVDDLGIQVAGQPNAEKMLVGSLLQSAGTAGLMYGAGAGAGAGGGADYGLGSASKAANPWGVTATPASGATMELFGSTPSFGAKSARGLQLMFGA